MKAPDNNLYGTLTRSAPMREWSGIGYDSVRFVMLSTEPK